jgi:hypothetical protein
MVEVSSVYRVLVGKPEGKRPLVRPKLRWEDNIKMGLQGVGCGVRTELVWLDRQVVSTCECGNELWGYIKCVEFLD